MSKTIRMPKATLALWLHHLRSGDVQQGQGALFDGHGYCCLGVLQCALTGGFVEYDMGTPAELPTDGWLYMNGISFRDSAGNEANDPYLPSLHAYAAEENDYGTSFVELADAIEACAVGY